jgi:hypothetical protein
MDRGSNSPVVKAAVLRRRRSTANPGRRDRLPVDLVG